MQIPLLPTAAQNANRIFGMKSQKAKRSHALSAIQSTSAARRHKYMENTNQEIPKFDIHQFARHSRAVSAETGISFADYKHMHQEWRERLQRANPHTWATEDSRFREALARYFWSRLMMPPEIFPKSFAEVDFKNFCALIDTLERRTFYRRSTQNKRWRRKQPKNFAALRALAKQGVTRVYLVVAWRVFRLGYDSIAACENLPVTPVGVRQFCLEVVDEARKWWPEMCPQKRSWGGKKGNTKAKCASLP